MSGLSSIKGLLSLLRETDDVIVLFALNRISAVLDEFWFEMTPADISLIEEHFENQAFSQEGRQAAALLASRTYFHLGAYDDAVEFALAAGSSFQAERSLYSDTILACCIDMYVKQREALQEGFGEDAPQVDERLEVLFTSLADQWQADKHFAVGVKELVGFFVRARRLDLLDKVLLKQVKSEKTSGILTYTLGVVNRYVRDIEFKRAVLLSLVRLFSEGLDTADYISLAECLTFLGDDERLATTLKSLLKQDPLMAYQVGFDLFENSNQDFLKKILARLTTSVEVAPSVPAPTPTEGEAAAAPAAASATATESKPIDDNLHRIISGELTTSLYLKFLYSRCNADIHILNQTKKQLDPRNATTHLATILSNAIMYSGTTIDGFMRDNLEWLGKANMWAKFTTTATIGSIHKGHADEAMNILRPHLPTPNSVGALPFQESGALFALGLIHSTSSVDGRGPAVEYLKGALRDYAANEIMVHGASLGLGLSAMGLNDEELFESLFASVSACDAVASEAAALAIGFVMLGSSNMKVIETLHNHAKVTDQKEKTIRGLSMAIALILFGRENEADPVVELLLQSADPWIRLGGVFALGLAYAGTGYTKAIEKLLEVTVKETSDEVRRNAVMMIGFVGFKDIDQCIDMVKPLLESYNPHVRYGVALALGIAGCGTAHTKATEMLWTLVKTDATDYVVQGAILSLSMLLMQATEADVPRVKEFRDFLRKTIANRNENACKKFGCIVGQGILDAGGRNCTIALHKNGHTIARSVVGLFVFTQHWYWFSYVLMLPLALQPTCVIGLNRHLAMPNYTITSNAPPSRFGIPKSVLAEKKEAKAAGVTKAVLSTTKKQNRKKKAGEPQSPVSAKKDVEDAMADVANTATAEAAVAAPEPTSEVLKNPARVTLRQLSVISHDNDSRYKPLKANPFGICMLLDEQPDTAEELVAIDPNAQADDVAPPEPFPWP